MNGETISQPTIGRAFKSPEGLSSTSPALNAWIPRSTPAAQEPPENQNCGTYAEHVHSLVKTDPLTPARAGPEAPGWGEAQARTGPDLLPRSGRAGPSSTGPGLIVSADLLDSQNGTPSQSSLDLGEPQGQNCAAPSCLA